MKILKEIISSLSPIKIEGSTLVEVKMLTLDSRKVEEGYCYAAIKGSTTDGHSFIKSAIQKGAAVILCEELPSDTSEATFIKVENTAKALGKMASAFYNEPSSQLKLIGITGTNGKTSIATMLYESYLLLNKKAGLLSTIKYCISGKEYASTHTTPNSVRINELLALMVDEGCEYAFMEVSSHALDQFRTEGLHFNGCVFTNITHDHLDYHPSFKDYIYTKKRLFDSLSSDAFAIYNKDDKNYKVMGQNSKATAYTYSTSAVSDFKIKLLEHDFNGMLVNIRDTEVWLQLVGKFNASNILAVYSTCFLLGEKHEDIIRVISALKSVSGRFQQIQVSGITAIVDYAHTPDALANVLETINAIRTGNEQLLTVVGCGGDRDREKRPLMAKIATKASNKVILTSDNPRTENPDSIIAEMSDGVEPSDFKKVLKITNREEAIKTAVSLAETGDVILVAGKGHETYQEIEGVRHDFDDRKVLIQSIKQIKE